MLSTAVETPWGTFTAQGDQWGVERIYLPGEAAPDGAEGPLPWDFAGQLTDYLAGTRRDWNLPFLLQGTPFRLAVLYACRDIPYGASLSYGELAQAAGYPGAARAVGHVMATNPLPLLIPCHRVGPADGSLGRYRGGEEMKERLRALEMRMKNE